MDSGLGYIPKPLNGICVKYVQFQQNSSNRNMWHDMVHGGQSRQLWNWDHGDCMKFKTKIYKRKWTSQKVCTRVWYGDGVWTKIVLKLSANISILKNAYFSLSGPYRVTYLQLHTFICTSTCSSKSHNWTHMTDSILFLQKWTVSTTNNNINILYEYTKHTKC